MSPHTNVSVYNISAYTIRHHHDHQKRYCRSTSNLVFAIIVIYKDSIYTAIEKSIVTFHKIKYSILFLFLYFFCFTVFRQLFETEKFQKIYRPSSTLITTLRFFFIIFILFFFFLTKKPGFGSTQKKNSTYVFDM